MFEDKTLVCRECGNEFVFTASEQQFYADKGFQNEPGRCPACRAARRAANGGANRGERQMYDVICDGCGSPPRFPSSPAETVRSTAAPASKPTVRAASDSVFKKSFSLLGRSSFFALFRHRKTPRRPS